jgi:hypothetical protein
VLRQAHESGAVNGTGDHEIDDQTQPERYPEYRKYVMSNARHKRELLWFTADQHALTMWNAGLSTGRKVPLYISPEEICKFNCGPVLKKSSETYEMSQRLAAAGATAERIDLTVFRALDCRQPARTMPALFSQPRRQIFNGQCQ